MKKALQYLSVVFAVVFSSGLYAQDLNKDMKSFLNGFTLQPSLECRMNSAAVNRKDNSFFFDTKIRLVIHNNQYYYNMGNMVYISNKQYLLWVDKKEKRIIIGNTDADEVKNFKKRLAVQLDTVNFKTKGKIVFDGVTDNVKTYRIQGNPEDMISETLISFDATTGYIKKMQYFFNSAVSAQIGSSYTEFTFIDTHPQVDESLFSLSEYVTISKGTIKLTQAYSHYELIRIDHAILNKLKK